MKRLIAMLLAIVLMLALNAFAENDLLEAVKARGSLVIATEGAWSPWTYHDESDQLVGFDVEVARAVAEKLGVEADFVDTATEGVKANMSNAAFVKELITSVVKAFNPANASPVDLQQSGL